MAHRYAYGRRGIRTAEIDQLDFRNSILIERYYNVRIHVGRNFNSRVYQNSYQNQHTCV